MRHTSYLEMLSGDSKHPCYFADTETYEMLYMNEAMEELLKNHQLYDSYRGKSCYRVLHAMTEPCSFCPNTQAFPFEFTEHSVYNGCTQGYFRVHTTLMNLDGSVVNMSKYFPGNANQPKYPLTFEYAMTQIAHILNTPRDHNPQIFIHSFLELLCQFYGAEQSYVIDVSTGTLQRYHNKHEKHDTLSISQLENANALDRFMAWLDYHSDVDVNEINPKVEHYSSDSLELEILHTYQAKNIAVSPLKNGKGDLLGFVGVSNRRCPVFDYRLLKAVSRFVQESFSTFTMEQELHKLNNLDLLTGFYNRNRYSDYLKELQRMPPEHLGVVFINLNGLRKTNEFFGYEVGDIQILKAVSQLKSHFHEDFYRISGDEFVCFVENCEKGHFISRVNNLQFELKKSNNTSYSVGSAWDSGHYEVLPLITTAETVMYINKQEYYFNAKKESEEITESILQDLLSALQNEEFIVYLQPKVSLVTGVLSGAESFIRRFDQKNQKMIYPDSFIPLYEKNSIIRHVDLFVLRTVCSILEQWGDTVTRVPISVNLSLITLTEYDIVQTVTTICDKYHIPHDLIIIEVTEWVALTETEVSPTLIDDFQTQGFKVALGHFPAIDSKLVVNDPLADRDIPPQQTTRLFDTTFPTCDSLEDTPIHPLDRVLGHDDTHASPIPSSSGHAYLHTKPIPHEEFYQQYMVGTS